MSFDEVRAAQEKGAVVLDTRDNITFAAGHLTGSINVGIDGRFADYAGQVVRPGTSIVLVTEPGQEAEGRLRLGRIGFDSVIGSLAEPVRTLVEHPEATTRSSRLTAKEMADRIQELGNVAVIDVRNAGETETGLVPGAVNIPLAKLLEAAGTLDPTTPTIVYCAGGYRSSVGASTLRWLGFTDVSDLMGGFGAWTLAGQPVETPTSVG
jgi:hydroxyacylglutathione hydrolase